MSTKKTILIASVLVTALTLAGFAIAQSMQHGQGMHGQMKGGMHGSMHGSPGQGHQGHASGSAPGDRSASSLAFNAVNEKMHRDMAITFSGDADADFARGMIPHHQGAVDMAKIILVFGKDPELKKLAESIVQSQEAEITLMNEWLKRRGK
jgi:uncharacterized protein (DUF305 family)